jgi:hypothetical protein
MEPECLLSLLQVSAMELAANPIGSSPHFCVSKEMSFEIHFNVILFCISYIPHECHCFDLYTQNFNVVVDDCWNGKQQKKTEF